MGRVGYGVMYWVPVVLCGLAVSTTATADNNSVTYEVVSSAVAAANIEYVGVNGRVAVQNVTLPWRMDVAVDAVHGAPPNGSQVRADWRRSAGPAKWVTVRISHLGKVICQNTLDVGNAACYGNTPRIT